VIAREWIPFRELNDRIARPFLASSFLGEHPYYPLNKISTEEIRRHQRLRNRCPFKITDRLLKKAK
jgi:hypothetical protein